MEGVNPYHIELSDDEIDEQVHRGFVGGMWHELGELQLKYLLAVGLKPEHKLLDIGCGCLRGGLRFIDYLDTGNYYGMDINSSLIDAGMIELDQAGLANKKPNLLVEDAFAVQRFGEKFDYLVSISVFTHLPMNMIVRCLSNAREVLKPEGVYYSTFFEAPTSGHINQITQQPGNIVTNYDADPYHHSIEELQFMAKLVNLELQVIGDWEHPRNQKMAAFTLPG